MAIPDELIPQAGPGEFRLRVGLRPFEPADWFVFGDDRAEAMAEKASLLSNQFDDVFRAEPGTEQKSQEILDEVVANLQLHHPDVWRLVKHELSVAGRHPLDTAARLVQDDLVLMDESSGTLRFVAGSVCAPNRWKLAVKFGGDMLHIHRPVPHYDTIAEPVERAMQRLTPERSLWRLNWNIMDNPARYQPAGPKIGPSVRTPEAAATKLWLRIERQTLRRFAKTDALVFGIRTMRCRIDELAGRSAEAAQLLGAVDQLPTWMIEHRDMSRYIEPLKAWLTEVAGT
jgi:dimethylamine monooxygenase subunit A